MGRATPGADAVTSCSHPARGSKMRSPFFASFREAATSTANVPRQAQSCSRISVANQDLTVRGLGV